MGIVDGRIVMPPLPEGRVLPVVTVPADVLSTPCVDVDPTDPAVVQLAADLLATQRVSPGCVGPRREPGRRGLAGLLARRVARTRSPAITHGEYVLVNARIESSSRNEKSREGCMSVPDFTGDVKRASRIVVRGFLPGTGEEVLVETDAFEARALQHELDHLDGFVFLDRVVGPHAVFARKTYL